MANLIRLHHFPVVIAIVQNCERPAGLKFEKLCLFVCTSLSTLPFLQIMVSVFKDVAPLNALITLNLFVSDSLNKHQLT